MKKILVILCIITSVICVQAQKATKHNKTATRHFIVPPPEAGYGVLDFYRSTILKQYHCIVTTEFQKAIDDATSTGDGVYCSEATYLSFFQVDTPQFEYQTNQKEVLGKILKDKVIDLATPSGRIEACRRLYYIAYLIKNQAPLEPGILKSDADTMAPEWPQFHCLGLFKLIPTDDDPDGTVVSPLLYCVSEKNEYVWYLWPMPQTNYYVRTKGFWYLGYQ